MSQAGMEELVSTHLLADVEQQQQRGSESQPPQGPGPAQGRGPLAAGHPGQPGGQRGEYPGPPQSDVVAGRPERRDGLPDRPPRRLLRGPPARAASPAVRRAGRTLTTAVITFPNSRQN